LPLFKRLGLRLLRKWHECSALGCAAMSAWMDDEENRWRNLGDQY
jgi:hypothetical protein